MKLGAPLLALLLSVGGCSGSEPETGAKESTGVAVPAALLDKTWPVRMSDNAARAPFEAQSGWASLFSRSHDEALAAFAGDPAATAGLARVHLEMAAFYRQAARLAANATVQVYGADHQAEDPVETPYLVGVSKALLGDLDGARAALAALPPKTAVATQAAAWSAWLAGGAAWPPDASLVGFPGQPGEVTPGLAPGAGDLPHYRFAELAGETREVAATDPTTLYLLSRWHEAAARKAAPQDDAVITQLLGLWRLPPEPAPAADLLPVGDAWLFASFVLTPEDCAFLTAAQAQGIAAVEAWKDRSPYAAAIAPAVVEGRVSPELMLDQAAWLGTALSEAMARRSGQAEGFQRPFADQARAGVLRAAMVVADAAGETRDAGVLRVNALDRSVQTAADPVFFMSVAAWDTGNRNALRAQDLLHGLLSRFPAAEASRVPLDAMHLRLGRNAAPATPVF